MRELNNTKIIAVDHDYGNIKTANTVTPTGITAYDTESIFSSNILEYNGRYYRIGEGHKEFVSVKWLDEDYYLLTMMGIAKGLFFYSPFGTPQGASIPRDTRQSWNTLRILAEKSYCVKF